MEYLKQIKKLGKITLKGTNLTDIINTYKKHIGSWIIKEIDIKHNHIYIAKKEYEAIIGFYMDYYIRDIYVTFYLHSIYRGNVR